MNKDVVYIEPEDDITDIITKIENSKEKIVALVPPKKASVFRSIVNIKLIAKAGATAGKTVVLVTNDPSIEKLAAVAKLPITKDLKTAPTIPEAESEEVEETTSKEDLIEKSESGEVVAEESADESSENTEIEPTEDKGDSSGSPADESDSEDDKESKTDTKAKKSSKEPKNPFLKWVASHKLIVGLSSGGALLLILLMIWAFVIAPSVIVTIGIRTTKNNFSENITFTETLTDENSAEGKFYLIEKKIESKSEIEFTATGKKNRGEKATGSVIVYLYFNAPGSVKIGEGTTFTNNNLAYKADKDTSLIWDGNNSSCENNNVILNGKIQCLISERVQVTAAEPGKDYNIEATSANWSTSAGVAVYSDEAMTGGTDDIIIVVQQSDIDNALKEISSSNESENKTKLYNTIDNDVIVIESSFSQKVGDPVSVPGVGEEVKDDKKAKLTVVTTDSVFAIDRTKVEEFISNKAKLSENYKIYEINDPFIENFVKSDNGYSGKLKTSYVSGPKVTENDVINLIRGKGLGTAQHDLNSVEGISKITIDTSYPWVSSIPNDPEKISIIINVEE